MDQDILTDRDLTSDIAVTPRGRIYIPSALSLNSQRVKNAFAVSNAEGFFYLVSDGLTGEYPPGITYWKEFAKLFLSKACHHAQDDFAVELSQSDMTQFLADVPPVMGSELISKDFLVTCWQDLCQNCQKRRADFTGSLQDFFHAVNPAWNMIGRVCFHLAENKSNSDKPFAFLATYAQKLSSSSVARHVPLAKALQDLAGSKNQSTLLALLKPVQTATEKSVFLRNIVDQNLIFEPLAWSPKEAHQFLQDTPIFESAGVVVRVPDWWKSRSAARPEIKITIGEKRPSALGLDGMLDFDVALTMENVAMTAAEWQEILKSANGLALIRGKWVEIDAEKMQQVLDHWTKVQRMVKEDGMTFAAGMRLLSGAGSLGGQSQDEETLKKWSHVDAGSWLGKMLEDIRRPHNQSKLEEQLRIGLKANLRPYQKSGVHWLWTLNQLGLGACLADDMGLGKTIQVIGLLLLLKHQKKCSLLIVPASLIGNWSAEIEKFAPELKYIVLHPSHEKYSTDVFKKISVADLAITTYSMLLKMPQLKEQTWNLLIADEAQSLKNPSAKQTQAAKGLTAKQRIVLTGTPVENRLSDLWSLFDFICPGLLGNSKQFNQFLKSTDSSHRVGSYSSLRKLVQPYILRRLKTDRTIISDLPDKTEMKTYCHLSKTQAILYQQAVEELKVRLETSTDMARRGLILSFLMRFKQICNHPTQWTKEGVFDADHSGKFLRLGSLCQEINQQQEKVLVFTQFREMTEPLARYLQNVFNREGLILHGDTPIKDRKKLVDAFQQDLGPPFFVLSIKAGGTGLNLTAASHVIHFDRWWNPAVENQATDRAFRIGQKRNVLVHKFISRGTIEEKVDQLIDDKKQLSEEILSGASEISLTELANDDLIKMVSLDLNSATWE